jgi:hypothetical protein
MHHVVHRLGFLRLSRAGAVLLLIIGVGVAAAFWIGPFHPLPARLNLFVSSGTSPRPNVVALMAAERPGFARARFPLVLAATNDGARGAMPTQLSLSIPASYRLVRGLHAIEPELTPGNPLARYTLDISGIALPADSAPYSILADTVWLEPALRDYDCIAISDSVPEFVPPPPQSAGALARVPVYYSFDGTPERQTGVFTAELDSTVLMRAPTAAPPEFQTYTREPEAPRPEMGSLHQVGTRKSQCGDPQDPMELYTVDWETAGGGRFLVVYLNGAPRKQLFDLNRDSIIELEMWDPNHDGRFEAWRQAHYAIPTIVLPERLPIAAVSNDSLINDPRWLETFEDTSSGPYRFLTDSARARRIPPVPADTAVAHVDSADGVRRIVIDTAWVRVFNNVSAGPYRFLKNPPRPRSGAMAAAQAARDSARRAAARRPPRRTGPLGVPVQLPPPDTGHVRLRLD